MKFKNDFPYVQLNIVANLALNHNDIKSIHKIEITPSKFQRQHL